AAMCLTAICVQRCVTPLKKMQIRVKFCWNGIKRSMLKMRSGGGSLDWNRRHLHEETTGTGTLDQTAHPLSSALSDVGSFLSDFYGFYNMAGGYVGDPELYQLQCV